MNKKGQSLPLNTVIIIILIVIVLIVIAVFFLGGTSKLSESIRNIFYGATSGTDETLAVSICEQRCEESQDYKGLGKAPFCTPKFSIDRNGDGKIKNPEGASDATKEAGITCKDLVGDCSTNTGVAIAC